MARVNHKLVKQRLNEKRSKITDRQFFTSRILAGHFEDMAAAQTRRYDNSRRVHVQLYWKPADRNLAGTDNLHILINAGNKMITKVKGRENRYQLVSGLFAHELGHVLHTDFLAIQTYCNFLDSGHWYPVPPDLSTSLDARNEKAFWEYANATDKNMKMVKCMAKLISNVLEDGYVENRIQSQFPGTFGYSLGILREAQFQSIPTVTQLIEKEECEEQHIFESIFQLMLSYAKYGEIKYGDEPLSDERIQTVFGLITDIDKALMTKSGKERLGVVSTILVRCWNYIQDYLEECKKKYEDADTAGAYGSVTAAITERGTSIAGSSAMGIGNTTGIGNDSPAPETSGANDLFVTAGKRAKTRMDAESSSENNENDSNDTEGETESGVDEDENVSGTEENQISESELLLDDSASETGKQKVSESESGRIPYRQSEYLSEPKGGTTEVNESYERERYDNAATDIERILDKMAEKAACEQLENERLRELNDVAQNISYGDIHKGVNIRINRIASVDEELIEQYDSIADPLLTISRQLQKSLARQFKESRRGGKQTGLMMGRRLDVHALCRNDGKVFYKNSLPVEIPELAVGLLLDESGSMSSCDRCTYARASAIILYDFCQSLEIPVMVYGHSTESSIVELYSYAEFESFDRDDKYRMMDISARNNNRDGAALRFVAEQLSKRPETVKILILVSDGEPADSGYYGSEAEEDLRGIKQEYQRKGILFVAAAIGDDKQNIERIYGDSFLDITDLNQLPTKLTAIVKRHINV